MEALNLNNMNKFSRLCCVLLTVVNCYSNTDQTKCSLCVWSGRTANKEALHFYLNGTETLQHYKLGDALYIHLYMTYKPDI